MQLDICHKLVECCAETEKNLSLMISKEDLDTHMEIQETGLECLNHPEHISSFSEEAAANNTQNTLSKAKANQVILNVHSIKMGHNNINFSGF
jgi:hypothetical protein